MVDNIPTLAPPPKPTLFGQQLNDLQSISNYITRDLFNYLTNFYNHAYFIWKRTGGYTSASIDLSQIKVSAQEINTLAGINTAFTVQVQLNNLETQKADIASLGTMAYQNSDSVAIGGGIVLDTLILQGIIQDSDIEIKQGASGQPMSAGGIVNVNTVEVGNVGAGEDDLITYLLAANSLDVSGAFIEFEAFGTFAANANNKRIRLYFGTILLYDSGPIAANSGSWIIQSKVIRTNSGSQKAISTVISDNALMLDSSFYMTGTEDLSTDINIRCTGEGIADNDVIQEGLIIKLFNG